MMLKKLKPYVLAAGMGLAGLLGSDTIHAAEPENVEMAQSEQETFLGRPITEGQRQGLRMLPALPELVLSYLFVESFIHESGHAVAMLAFGHPIAEFHPYPGKGTLGYVVHDIPIDRTKGLEEQRKQAIREYHKFPAHERAIVNVAGCVFSRAYAESIDALVNSVEMNPFVEQALAATYLTMRVELARYAVLSMVQNWGKTDELTGDDVHNFARLFSKDPETQKWVYAGLVGLIALDMVLDWDEIKDNWDRLWMSNYSKKKKSYEIGVLPTTDGGVQASFSYNF